MTVSVTVVTANAGPMAHQQLCTFQRTGYVHTLGALPTDYGSLIPPGAYSWLHACLRLSCGNVELSREWELDPGLFGLFGFSFDLAALCAATASMSSICLLWQWAWFTESCPA